MGHKFHFTYFFKKSSTAGSLILPAIFHIMRITNMMPMISNIFC